ncbi:sensor histidine kinase [Halosimplex amylolyticum]|uniref:sensor histidine kinase n=1 Tax=Halosimplex amylolyticum TaxID=3396616 RepID=UPI003F571899
MNEGGTVAWVGGASEGRTGASSGAEAQLERSGFAVERIRVDELAGDVTSERPDCLVCDADSCADAVEVVRTVREVDPAVPVVVLAREGDEDLAHRTVAAGATEYVPSTADGALDDAVERAIGRGRPRGDPQRRSQTDRVDEFADVVGHDLRNPLGAVRHRIEMARRTGDDGHLDDALAALDRTGELLSDLTARAREARPASDTERVSLATVARSAWEHVPTGESTLVVVEDRTIAADPKRLTQLLENLFVNAAEHGPGSADEGVEVSVGVDRDGCLYVEDDGLGIPVEDRNAVFQSDYSTAADGTGYGLVSVRRIARAHDWTVEVTESEEGGARFEVRGAEVGDS